MVTLPPPPPASGASKAMPRVQGLSSAGSPPSTKRESPFSPKVGIYSAFFVAVVSTSLSVTTLIVAGDSLELRLWGYVLGGIIGPIALGVDTVSQRTALRDPNFSPMLKLGLATKILAFAGIASAIIQVLVASTQISEFISELLIQAGWQL